VATIPAYNEERMIGRVVIETQKHVDEVIVVDDGSTDLTGEIAQRLGAKVVRHDTNLGYGATIKTALESGYSEQGDVVITIDGDGQHNPNNIPSLVRSITKNGSDLAIGSRFSKGREGGIPRRREFGVRLITRIVSAATNNKFNDTQSGIRAYSRKALRLLLPSLLSNGMGLSIEILMKARDHGLRIDEIPAEVVYKTGERTSSKNSFAHGGELVISIVELVAEKRPLLFIGVPGIASLVIGFLTLLLLFGIFNETRQLAIGTALLSIGSTLVGLVMVFGAVNLYSMNRWMRRIESHGRNQFSRPHLQTKVH
jgi:glycosyltransferase involved in cell wall biosynthesis